MHHNQDHGSSTARNPASILYPNVQSWLTYCDKHLIQGCDGENYVKYAHALVTKCILHLDDIAGLEHMELQQFCDGMETGTARRLLHFALEDVEALKQGHDLHI